ncbi:glutaredoxin [Hassallia byssoidea VB512170]|uniref:Glutaredoxin n=1 Tax=Hassallia byssoidea VB512170 TaxID=1304833 RepID=A0A846H5B6_9CYAN|nr:thioredoxin family protein [Hassalia byssoidea]NEU71799.1 glutaredoxin [Hassalia byssoidea VB512170]
MTKHLVEVFTAGCPLCDETVKLVRELACENCEIQIYDLREGCATNECLEKTTKYGIHRIPAVVVNSKLAECCSNQQPVSREALIAAGIGQG